MTLSRVSGRKRKSSEFLDSDQQQMESSDQNKQLILSQSENESVVISAEFQILQSLIPDIANKSDITELEIIDACVDYIESLQDQLDLHWQKRDSSSSSSAHQDPKSLFMQRIRPVSTAEKLRFVKADHNSPTSNLSSSSTTSRQNIRLR